MDACAAAVTASASSSMRMRSVSSASAGVQRPDTGSGSELLVSTLVMLLVASCAPGLACAAPISALRIVRAFSFACNFCFVVRIPRGLLLVDVSPLQRVDGDGDGLVFACTEARMSSFLSSSRFVSSAVLSATSLSEIKSVARLLFLRRRVGLCRLLCVNLVQNSFTQSTCTRQQSRRACHTAHTRASS